MNTNHSNGVHPHPPPTTVVVAPVTQPTAQLADPPAHPTGLHDITSLVEALRPTIRTAVQKVVREEVEHAMKDALATALGTTTATLDENGGFHAFRQILQTKDLRNEHGVPVVPSRTTPTVPTGVQVCSVAGCGKPARSKGLCAAHYQAVRRKGLKAAAKREERRKAKSVPTKAAAKHVRRRRK